MSCSICYEAFDNETEIPCGHSFCKKCIDRWAETNNTCPLCREVFCEQNTVDDDGMDTFLTMLTSFICNENYRRCIVQDYMSNEPHGNIVPLCKLFWTSLNREMIIRTLLNSGVSITQVSATRNTLRRLIYEGPGTRNNPIEL